MLDEIRLGEAVAVLCLEGLRFNAYGAMGKHIGEVVVGEEFHWFYSSSGMQHNFRSEARRGGEGAFGNQMSPAAPNLIVALVEVVEPEGDFNRYTSVIFKIDTTAEIDL